MAIPGITDRSRLPRLGKVRLGEKRESKSGKEYPAKLDHFNFKDCPEIAKLYPGECREIYPIYLPADDEDVFFPTARKAYRSSGLFCACNDGETATRVFSPNDEQGVEYLKQVGQEVKEGEMFDLPCPAEDCPYVSDKYCKPVGRLFIIIPNVPRFGVYEISTSSFNSMVNILSDTRAIRRAVGTVANVPLALRLEPLIVQPGGKKTTVFVLKLEYKGSVYDLAKLGRQIEGKPGLLGIPAPGDPVPDDIMPRGGESLEAKLSGQPTVAMPQPLPPEPEPEPAKPVRAPKTAKPVEAVPAAAPAPAAAPVAATSARATVATMDAQVVNNKTIMWITLGGIEGKFYALDEQVVNDARSAMQAQVPVDAQWIKTAAGNKRLTAIEPAVEELTDEELL